MKIKISKYYITWGIWNRQYRTQENLTKPFLPHDGFPHNNLAIPPCLVFWWVSIPRARSIQGTANGAGVIISRSVMKLLRQKDELWGNFTTWIFYRLSLAIHFYPAACYGSCAQKIQMRHNYQQRIIVLTQQIKWIGGMFVSETSYLFLP